jgi:hypothetical protein
MNINEGGQEINLNNIKKLNYNSEINLLELPKGLEKMEPSIVK